MLNYEEFVSVLYASPSHLDGPSPADGSPASSPASSVPSMQSVQQREVGVPKERLTNWFSFMSGLLASFFIEGDKSLLFGNGAARSMPPLSVLHC